MEAKQNEVESGFLTRNSCILLDNICSIHELISIIENRIQKLGSSPQEPGLKSEKVDVLPPHNLCEAYNNIINETYRAESRLKAIMLHLEELI